jgi:putative oxidoreductase
MRVIPARFSDPLYCLLRFVAGALFACHGAQKLFGVLGGQKVSGNTLMTIAGVIELGGGILIALGLLTSVAAFIASGEMAVAYFKAHAPQSFWPIENQGELTVVYCFLFLFMAAYGGGSISLDRMIRRGAA